MRAHHGCVTHSWPARFRSAARSRCSCSMFCLCLVAAPNSLPRMASVTGCHMRRLSIVSCEAMGRTSLLLIGWSCSKSTRTRCSYGCVSSLSWQEERGCLPCLPCASNKFDLSSFLLAWPRCGRQVRLWVGRTPHQHLLCSNHIRKSLLLAHTWLCPSNSVRNRY